MVLLEVLSLNKNLFTPPYNQYFIYYSIKAMIRRHKTNWLLVLLLNLLFVSNYIKLCEAIRKHESIDNYEVTDANKLDTEKEVGKTSFFTVTDKINRRKTDKSTKFR